MASSTSAAMAAYWAARSTKGTDGSFDSLPGPIPTIPVPMTIVLFSRPHLDGRPSALERAIDGVHDPHDLPALRPAGERAPALRDALQEVATLIPQWLADHDPGADDVAVAQAELVR